MPDNSDCSRIPAPNIWAPKELVTVKPDMAEIQMKLQASIDYQYFTA